jgi:hypothetical protein
MLLFRALFVVALCPIPLSFLVVFLLWACARPSFHVWCLGCSSPVSDLVFVFGGVLVVALCPTLFSLLFVVALWPMRFFICSSSLCFALPVFALFCCCCFARFCLAYPALHLMTPTTSGIHGPTYSGPHSAGAQNDLEKKIRDSFVYQSLRFLS